MSMQGALRAAEAHFLKVPADESDISASMAYPEREESTFAMRFEFLWGLSLRQRISPFPPDRRQIKLGSNDVKKFRSPAVSGSEKAF